LQRRRLALWATLGGVVLATAGCGTGGISAGKADTSNGKALFEQKCGSCHTLADAKTQGTIGPNLDDAFSSDKQQGFSQQTMADVVRGQIAYPEKPMPPKLVEGTDADDISVYIAKCSGNPNCGVTAARPAPPAGGTTTTTPSGGGGQPNGKAIFTSAGCAGCHTLKDAGATGKVGPNLDQLKPPKDRVVHQVEVGGGAMPAFKGRLSDAQIQAVSAYVAQVAGK
jgi:mono/diheme cytochrome c family protein